MKSDIIVIDNQGKGFHDAVAETKKVAKYAGMDKTNSLHLQLLTEEMLSMVKILTGEVSATFWIEVNGSEYKLNVTTNAVLDAERRAELIEASSSRKNAAATGFLGMLRDAQTYDLSKEELDDIAGRDIESTEWDGYERSVLHKLADDVKIAIVRNEVSMTVTKTF